VSNSKSLQNFGRNLEFQPAAYYEPRSEGDVLEILARHRGEQIRTIGSLHSWSAAPVGQGVVINLKHFQQIDVHGDHETSSATVGAGCQIKTVLRELANHGKTLPSLGLITEQTIAGAIATGTHGSGRHSMSHYVEAVRVARYDETTGSPVIEQIEDGAALWAARCSLSCLGVILSVRIRCRGRYNIEEHWHEYQELEPVLAAENNFPLQQFFLIPWRWTYFAQHRCETPAPRSRLASMYRVHWFLSVDLGLHLMVLLAVRVLASFRFVRLLFRHLLPKTIIRDWKVTDDSAAMLIMEHELFRHIEIELFVPSRELPAALNYVRQVLIVSADTSRREAGDIPSAAGSGDDAARLEAIRGQYRHHYPICVRRILPDDTLISMAAGDGQIWYSISLISYAHPADRAGFEKLAGFLAETMAEKFGTRPHWGKLCPLAARKLVELYPRFEEFCAACESRDPNGVFRNAWLAQLFDSRGASQS
jgi:FAD/FMN-containing dehydrogenase